jgi:PAS domain S-box-containing protein
MKNNPDVLRSPDSFHRQTECPPKNEAFFEALTKNAGHIILVLNKNAAFTYVNPAVETILGYRPEELIGTSAFQYVHPPELEKTLKEFEYTLLTNRVRIPFTFGILHKNGTLRILEGGGVNLLSDPAVKGIILNLRDATDRMKAEAELSQYRKHLEDFVEKRTQDISRINAQLIKELDERKAIEQALLESEEKYRHFIENAPIGVGIIDLSGKVQYINKEIETVMGWRREDVIGKYGFGLESFDEETRLRLLERFRARLEGDKPKLFEMSIKTKGGKVKHVQVITTILKKGNAPVGAQMVFVDLSEREKAEAERKELLERLHRTEKMESLGALAGSVAHDLNNVLGVLVGYTELLLTKTADGDPNQKHLQSILRSSEKATAIIQDLLTLARRNVNVTQIVNLNQIVAEFFLTPEFERLTAHHPTVTFQSQPASDLLNLKGSPVHLTKTVMNLLSNAAEAITESGNVIVTTENVYLHRPLPGYHDVREGDYVVLRVQDDGQGIRAEDKDKIFEPFYTKKVMGRSGTGLGLAVVWGTVKDHQGYITVESQPGQGSVFCLYFPATRQRVAHPRQKARFETLKGNGQKVLIVDDLPEQREVAQSLLEELGYQAVTAESGLDAVEYLKNHPADIVVLDMLMEPGIDGLETYRRMLQIRPGQKAILVSGYSETKQVKEALALGACEYLRKPYTLEKIGTALQRALGREEPH